MTFLTFKQQKLIITDLKDMTGRTSFFLAAFTGELAASLLGELADFLIGELAAFSLWRNGRLFTCWPPFNLVSWSPFLFGELAAFW